MWWGCEQSPVPVGGKKGQESGDAGRGLHLKYTSTATELRGVKNLH